MENESEKYSRGSSGFGAPDYTSPAWRAGDLERQRLQQEERNGSGKSSKEEPVSDGDTSFNAWAYLITWFILFYLTYQIYVPFVEMIFGKNLHVSELVKWLNVVIIMVPPTVIVYLFRRFIPSLFALSIILGILGLAYGMLKS